MLTPIAHPQFDSISTWIFDLDNTIYPASMGLFDRISARMTLFIEGHFGLDSPAAFALQKDLFTRFGTTAAGLAAEHNIDPLKFMDFVHDIDLSTITPDAELDGLLGGLTGTKIIFTNGTKAHARRILDSFGVRHHFGGCFDIVASQHRPKPNALAYQGLLKQYAINPAEAVMIDDLAVNLVPASDLGITTVWLGTPEATAEHIDYTATDLKSFLYHLRSDNGYPTTNHR